MGHVLTDNIPQYSKKLQPLSNLDLLLTLRTHGFYTSRTQEFLALAFLCVALFFFNMFDIMRHDCYWWPATFLGE